MNIEFNNIKELYKRVGPALRVKRRILLKKGINIKEEEIFKYLAKEKWSKGRNLTLSDIVSDIINVKDDVFIGR